MPAVFPSLDDVAVADSATPLTATTLVVDWLGDTDSPAGLVKAACMRLAQPWRRGAGPWGLGLFRTIVCQRDGRDLLDAPDVAATHAISPTAPTMQPWRLAVTWGPTTVTLNMVYTGSRAAQRQWRVTVAARPWTPATMAKDAVYDRLLAAALLVQMPIVAADSSASPHWERPPPATEDRAPADATAARSLASAAPERVDFYALSAVSGADDGPELWRVGPPAAKCDAFGLAHFARPNASAQLVAVAESRDQPPPASAVAAATEDVPLPSAEQGGAAPPPSGPARDADAAATRASAKHRGDPATLPRYALGLRLGRELVNPHGADLAPTILIGADAAIYSGPLRGVSLAFDLVPAATERTNGEDLYLAWQRVVVARDFVWPLACGKAAHCRAGLAAKVGF